MSTPAYITPQVLEWARNRAGVSVTELAAILKVTSGNVQAWERGAERPSFSRAESIAKKLRIPFGYLFLSKPPADDVPLPDLRTETGERPEHPSLDFVDIVQNTLLKQQWFSDYLQAVNAPKLPFVGAIRLGSDVTKVAE